jgi:hypothetical protein
VKGQQNASVDIVQTRNSRYNSKPALLLHILLSSPANLALLMWHLGTVNV